MCGHTSGDKIRNEDIHGNVGVTFVVGKMWKVRQIVRACEKEEHEFFSEEVWEIEADILNISYGRRGTKDFSMAPQLQSLPLKQGV